jgi:hypothetical protein
MLYLVAVMTCKWLINPITNPNPVTNTRDNILDVGYEGLDRIQLTQNRFEWQAAVNTTSLILNEENS